jgi:hypothetical protein
MGFEEELIDAWLTCDVRVAAHMEYLSSYFQVAKERDKGSDPIHFCHKDETYIQLDLQIPTDLPGASLYKAMFGRHKRNTQDTEPSRMREESDGDVGRDHGSSDTHRRAGKLLSVE